MSNRNVIIDGNFFEDTVISGEVTYYFDDVISVSTSSIINNNVINATPTNNLLNVTDDSVISSNYFNPKLGTSLKSIYATGSCEISNNSFTSPVTSAHLDISGNCRILGNNFSSAFSNFNFIKLNNCQCIVSKNNFTRGSTSINSYILITGTSGHQIVENYFDQGTINGTNELVVNGVSSSDYVVRNRNQIDYVMTMPIEHPYVNAVNTGAMNGLTVQGPYPRSYYANTGIISYNTGYTGVIASTIFVNLSKVLPPKAKVLQILTRFAMTVGSNVSGVTLVGDVVKTKSAYPITSTGTNPLSSPTSTLASLLSQDILNSTVIVTQSNSITDSTPKYINLDLSSANTFNDGVNGLILRLGINYTPVNNTATETNFAFSPVLVRYAYN